MANSLREAVVVKRILMVAGVVLLCVPMLFVGWLLAAAKWPKMDVWTMRMPVGMRQMVAQVAMQKAGWGKAALPQIERVNRMDPANADAWTRRCTSYFGEKKRGADVATCKRAVSMDGSAGNYNGLGDAQERAGDFCGAEESYAKAAGGDSSTNDYESTERMGRVALRCGDLSGARAGLEVALDKEDRSLKQPAEDDDEVADTKNDLFKDREFLVVVYERAHEPSLAKVVCSQAHPDWKGCACGLDKDGDVKCEEKR